MKLKNKLRKIKMFLNKDTVLAFWYVFVDSFGFLRSIFIYLFQSIKKPGIFRGYKNYYWAGKYADKRTNKWKSKWDQDGKQQGVFPIGDLNLLVCSKMELVYYKKKGLVNKKFKPRKAIKKSYYTTKL